MTVFQRAIPTPCIGVCQLGPDGLCDGCFRTGNEIAAWSQMSDEQRLRFMDEVLPEREARRA
jgi:predicted Fe-S protein YdhL (DUF1289 family)